QALLTELANAGATPGTPAYDAAMQQYNQRLNDLNLALDLQAGNEARANYGTELGARTQAINELTGLLGLGQVQGFQPQAVPQTGIAPTDVLGAHNMAYQGALNNYNQLQANRRGMIGGLAGLGGAALGGWAMGGFANPFAGSSMATTAGNAGYFMSCLPSETPWLTTSEGAAVAGSRLFGPPL